MASSDVLSRPFGIARLARCAAAAAWLALTLPALAQKPPPKAAPPASAAADAPADTSAARAVSAHAQRIVEKTRAQLLQVRTLLKEQDSQSSVGSGFIVDAGGLAITNYHVVSQYALRPERYRLAYALAQGRSGALQLLAVDVVHDLALVRLVPDAKQPLPTLEPLAFRPAAVPLAKGERIHSLGNPLDVGFAVAEGVYNGLVERSFLPQIFFGGSLNAGMSGGPAVDDQARVVGVNVAARRDGEQVSFLVPAEHARALLERARSATPVTQPVFAEVTRQLMAHQAELVGRFVEQPWRSANHPLWRVPVPQESFMRCWGSTSPETRKSLRFERSDCAMNSAVYVTPRLRTAFVTVRHEAYDGSELGVLRYTREYAASFRNEQFGSGPAATAPRCREGFTDHGGLAMRSVVCLTALKRFDGLFNLSVLATTLDHPTQGVQGRLDANGIDFANALKLTEHYLQGFARQAAGKSAAP